VIELSPRPGRQKRTAVGPVQISAPDDLNVNTSLLTSILLGWSVFQ